MAKVITLEQLTTVTEAIKNYFTGVLSELAITTAAAIDEVTRRLIEVENGTATQATVDDIKAELRNLSEHAIFDSGYVGK